jgi:ribosomal subunit interface protein
MEIRVTGRQIETGDALKTHVETRLQAIADKYFSKAIRAQVTFAPAPHGAFHCDIVAHVMSGVVLKGAGEAQDAHQSFDRAAEKIDKQLRRYMSRLRGRPSIDGGKVAAEEADGIANGFEDAAYTVFAAFDDEEEVAEDAAPAIVAEMRVDIPQTSVSDAVMMLDLRNTNALLFLNSGTSSLNMVYRRNDGTIGWVEPPR